MSKKKHNKNKCKGDCGNNCYNNAKIQRSVMPMRGKHGRFVSKNEEEAEKYEVEKPQKQEAMTIDAIGNAICDVYGAVKAIASDVFSSLQEAKEAPVYSIDEVNEAIAENTHKVEHAVREAVSKAFRLRARMNFLYGFLTGGMLVAIAVVIAKNFSYWL